MVDFNSSNFSYLEGQPWQEYQPPPGATKLEITVIGASGGSGPDSKSIAGIVSLLTGLSKLKGALHDAESQMDQTSSRLPQMEDAISDIKKVQAAVEQAVDAVQGVVNAAVLVNAEVVNKVQTANIAKDAATVSLASIALSAGFANLRATLK